jgi:hypothetical protein
MGVVFFIIKTIIVIFHEANDIILKKRYEIPVAAYTYMLFSIFFISTFIYKIYKSDCFTVFFNDSSNYYKNFYHSTTYMVILAFIWNFSKSFFTINALEYGVVGAYKIKLAQESPKKLIVSVRKIIRMIIGSIKMKLAQENQENLENSENLIVSVKNTGIIVEIIIRMIVATCFILTEQYLYNFFDFNVYKFGECSNNYLLSKIYLLPKIKSFAQYTIVLYISLLVWLLYFNVIFKNRTFLSLFKDKWSWQFICGLLLSFLLLHFRIGHFDVVLGYLLCLVLSFILCYLLICLEIEDFPNLKEKYLKK